MNRKAQRCRILFWVLSLLWMGTIFLLSAQTGEVSQSLSEETARYAFFFLIPGFSGMDQQQQQLLVQSVQFVIRKAAHMGMFAVLGMLLFDALKTPQRPIKGAALRAAIIGSAWAAIDELHQLTVPGRSGQLRDVLIDAVGVAMGVGFLCVLLWMRNRLAKRNRT